MNTTLIIFNLGLMLGAIIYYVIYTGIDMIQKYANAKKERKHRLIMDLMDARIEYIEKVNSREELLRFLDYHDSDMQLNDSIMNHIRLLKDLKAMKSYASYLLDKRRLEYVFE